MPYMEHLQTLREKAGLRISTVAKEADLARDTVKRVEKKHNTTTETIVSIVNVLNERYYQSNGGPLDPYDYIY